MMRLFYLKKVLEIIKVLINLHTSNIICTLFEWIETKEYLFFIDESKIIIQPK